MNTNEIDYSQRYTEDMLYILDELTLMQSTIDTMYSVAHKLNVNIDTMESLTIIKQGFDLIVNNVKEKVKIQNLR